MKRQLLFLALMLIPLFALADAVKIDRIYYNLNEEGKTAEVTRNPNPDEYSGNVTIPEKVSFNKVEYSVTKIGGWAFDRCSRLTSVTIPNSVTFIGEAAFQSSSLTSLTIPNSVTNIGDYTFNSCSSLTSVTIPNSVTNIGDHAFYQCSRLTSVTIPNSVTNIGDHAFAECSSMVSLSIPNSVTIIGSSAFASCKGLTSISIPNSVTTIGNSAFALCSGLTSVTIPNSVTTIGDGAFYGCIELTSITIPNSVTTIGDEAFYGCSGVTSIIVDDENTKYDSRDNCNAIIETKTNTLMFGCKNTVITNSVAAIGSSAFAECSNLTSITIPNSVTSIGDRAFYHCWGLTSISIPNSVTTMGVSAFTGCSKLTSITISNSVTSIENNIFNGCLQLKSVTIPNNVTSIGNKAFYNCSGLTSITISKNVTSIGDNAFYRCSNLSSVIVEIQEPITISYNTFSNYNNAILYVPAASVNAYKEAEPWKYFKQIVAIEGDTPSTPKCAKPTISYDNFKLTYSCETEGVEYVYDIKDSDIKQGNANEVSLSATYEISVYATKSGYDNSDVATATLVFTNATFTTEGTSSAKSVNVNPVLIQANNGIITIEGADDGERINVYSPAGSQEGSAISQNRLATINTHIKPGDIAIIKIGSRSVKVVMK